MKVQVRMFALLPKGNEWRTARLWGCDRGEPSAEHLLDEKGLRKGFLGKQNAFPNASFWLFLFIGMNKGLGKATV